MHSMESYIDDDEFTRMISDPFVVLFSLSVSSSSNNFDSHLTSLSSRVSSLIKTAAKTPKSASGKRRKSSKEACKKICAYARSKRRYCRKTPCRKAGGWN